MFRRFLFRLSFSIPIILSSRARHVLYCWSRCMQRAFLHTKLLFVWFSIAIRKALPIKVIIGCITLHWMGLCFLIIALPGAAVHPCPYWALSKVIFRRTDMPYMKSMARKKRSPTWPVGHTHAVSLKRHWTMIVPELKRHF